MELEFQPYNDQALMDAAFASYKGIKLQGLISIHHFLQVFFLSDITTSDGLSVDEAYLSPTMSTMRKLALNWPIQRCPEENCWKLWREYIHKSFTGSNNILENPFGEWLASTHTTQEWLTTIDPTSNTVYIYQNELWNAY